MALISLVQITSSLVMQVHVKAGLDVISYSVVQSPMTLPTISVQGLDISPEIMDLQTAEAVFENFTSP